MTREEALRRFKAAKQKKMNAVAALRENEAGLRGTYWYESQLRSYAMNSLSLHAVNASVFLNAGSQRMSARLNIPLWHLR